MVGRNGCGKSTLLKVVSGELELSEGTGEEKLSVAVSGEPVIGCLKQIAFENDGVSMLDEVKKAYAPILDLEEKIGQLRLRLETDPSDKKRKGFFGRARALRTAGRLYVPEGVRDGYPEIRIYGC